MEEKEWSSFKAILEQIESDAKLKFELELYLFCMKFKTTHAAYNALVNLQIPATIPDYNRPITMNQNAAAPARFPTLERHIHKLLHSFLPIRTINLPVLGSIHKTPYLNISSVCFLWLMSPLILASIKHSVEKYIIPHLDLENTEATLATRIETLKSFPTKYGLNRIEHSVEFLAILQRTVPLWKPAFKANSLKLAEEKRTVIFLHLRLYNDDFSWKDKTKATKGQTIIAITAAEISRAIRGSPSALGVIPVMLTSAQGVKENGMGPIFNCYTAELEEFSKGVHFTINGAKYLVFGFMWDFPGDSPARARMYGFSISVVHSFPCLSCLTPLKEFAEAARDATNLGEPRTAAYHQTLLAANGTGALSGSTKTVANTLGIVSVPETITWPGQNIPESEKLDLMHSDPLGSLQKDFQRVAKLIKSTTLYSDLSREFARYCKRNRIAAEYEFKDAATLKGLKAYGLKEFFLVSCQLLLFLKVIDQTNATLSREFHYYCIRIRIFNLMCLHTLSVCQFDELGKLIETILKFYGSDHPDSITFNVHLLHHVIPSIINYGIPREHWCFVYEHLIKFLKSYYANTNNRGVSFGVFRRHVAVMFIELMKQVQGSPHSCPEQLNKAVDTQGHRLIDVETLQVFKNTMYTFSSGTATLNWQTLKFDDCMLVQVNGEREFGVFFALTSLACGEECNILVYRRPLQELEQTMKQDGCLQWLTYSLQLSETLFYCDAHESFVKRLKVLKEDSFMLVIDEASELYD
ncbi:hypothetical protein BDR26DRAFT_934369 [Obelidium mucronatum]|nr:hypothetical protein BDR26DRAFT_942202 [Obelidium mucronatum]KAI9325953.1 hypothetical protein BDR26DRAFT_941654 [Obelidium mucronatum]KAI9329098.1 hypothetical protein BDR26DRAFT_939588 [Obelidium mucronatum]KAI9340497.1 hypothetical protein BDR26DRAFT_934369 [Obelidium mucronatum]